MTGQDILDEKLNLKAIELSGRRVFNEPLTEREQEVLGLLCTGSSNRDMAGRLLVSERTIESHLYR